MSLIMTVVGRFQKQFRRLTFVAKLLIGSVLKDMVGNNKIVFIKLAPE